MEEVSDSQIDPSIGYVHRKQIVDIDLGLATNPLGSVEIVDLENITLRDILMQSHDYPSAPYHEDIDTILIKHFNMPEGCQIIYSSGSYGAGDTVIRMMKDRGFEKVISLPLSFPNVAQWADRANMDYKVLDIDLFSKNIPRKLDTIYSLAFEIMPDDLKNCIVYLDVPNNPMGAIPEINKLNKLVDFCKDRGAIILLDIAFGEIAFELLKFINKVLQNNGIIIASLSKTMGIPGARAGFAALAVNLTTHLKNKLVFQLDSLHQIIYQKLYATEGQGISIATQHARRSAEFNSAMNKRLYTLLRRLGFAIWPTDKRSPIQVVYSRKDNLNLYEFLLNLGVLTEKISSYSVSFPTNLSNRQLVLGAVRMLTPNEKQFTELWRRLQISE